MTLLQQFADASFGAVIAVFTLVMLVACILTFYVVRWKDGEHHKQAYDTLAVRNVRLTLALEKLLRLHDFLTPHPGETCEEFGCALPMDEIRRLLNDAVVALINDELRTTPK